MSISSDRKLFYERSEHSNTEARLQQIIQGPPETILNRNSVGWWHFLDIKRPKPERREVLFSHLQSIFLLDKQVRKWRILTARQRSVLVRKHYSTLKKDVITKLCNTEWDRLEAIFNTLEAMNDNLYLSNIDRIESLRRSPTFWKFQKWVISSEVHRPGSSIEQFKLFIGLVKHRAIMSETINPPCPTNLMGFSGREIPNELPKVWENICPWLANIWRWGSQSKTHQTRVMHLCGSRGFPPPPKHIRELTSIEHAELITGPTPEPDPTREKILFILACKVGKTINDIKLKTGKNPVSAHLSLTNSAAFESSVRKGGRSRAVAEKFRQWRLTIPDTDINQKTWFGTDYVLRKGVPIWKTICYPEGKPHFATYYSEALGQEFTEDREDFQPGESSCIMDPTIGYDPETFKYADPIYALDKYTGYQLLQWSIEEGLRENFLLGSPFADPSNPLRVNPKRPPRIRVANLGEPGWKTRVVTVGEDWLTIFLQPFSHQMCAELEVHPSARVGLTRGWQLFEYIKQISHHDLYPEKEDRFWLSSDLKTATDFCRHDFSKSLLQGFLTGLKKNHHYYTICVDLLTGPREYLSDLSNLTYSGRYTTRGILMGDPGAKVVLTITNLVAELEAYTRFHLRNRWKRNIDMPDEEFLNCLIRARPRNKRWRHFAVAGDDHFAHGPRDYLYQITQSHVRNGMSVSLAKNFLSKRGGFYTEEAFFLHRGFEPENFWGKSQALQHINYWQTPHIDALKMRLFSPTAKECDGKDEPNPAIGRAQTMSQMLGWWAGGFDPYRDLASCRWEARLKAYLPQEKMFRYMPALFGGVGTPSMHIAPEQMFKELEQAPENLKKAWLALMKGDLNPLVKRALATFSTNARARGINVNEIEDQIKEVLQNPDLVKITDVDTLKPEQMTQTDWDNLRIRDKVKYAAKRGIIDIATAVQMIDRPYTFRDLLYPDMSRKHGIDPYRKNTYVKLPWRVRENRFLRILNECDLLSQLDYSQEEIEEGLINLSVKITKGELPPMVEKAFYFIPRSVVETDDLCTLQTPLVETAIKTVPNKRKHELID